MPAPIETIEYNDKPTIGPFFLDSGAHSLYMGQTIGGGGLEYFDSKEFWCYVDGYAEFIKRHKGIDYYANVDVVYDPKRTWKVQKYLEREHGLKPVPVVHHGAESKWLHKYLDDGYDPIALGGFGQDATKEGYFRWADNLFDIICPRPERLPIVRIHGFAMTSFELLRRYPWWSVDSASWTKAAGFGRIFVPRTYRGHFSFDRDPYCIAVSEDERTLKKAGHVLGKSKKEQELLKRWLDEIKVPLGRNKVKKGKVIIREYGVINSHPFRRIANLKFFQAMCDSLPEWPWPFRLRVRRGIFEYKKTHIKTVVTGPDGKKRKVLTRV